jgi:ribosome-interacting GTPase 1
MSQFGSPLKLCPSSPKKVRMMLNGTNVLYARLLIKMRNVSKNSLIEAMEASVFFRVVHSVSDIDNLRSNDTSMLYHRSCYKTYTSRRNCGFFKVESAGSDHKPDTSQVPLLSEQTDDTSTDIALCIFC